MLALKLELVRGVPFTAIEVTHLGRTVSVPNSLVDTGLISAEATKRGLERDFAGVV